MYGCVFTENRPSGLRCPLSKYHTRIIQKCSHKLLWALVFPQLALLSLSCWHHAAVTNRTWHNENKKKKKKKRRVRCDVENSVFVLAPVWGTYQRCARVSVCTVHHGKSRTSVEGADKKAFFPHYFIVNIAGGCREQSWKQTWRGPSALANGR